MQVSFPKRAFTAYMTVGKNFGTWFSPIITGVLLLVLRIIIICGMMMDYILFPSLWNIKVEKPIIIVGNPRSGTTFFHRYLVNQKIGIGSQLWQLLYPSITIQKFLKPILPLLEKISPTRHHSTAAHKTSLTSVETDDSSILFRYLDGFFLYGFILSWSKKDLFSWFDPRLRNTTQRDYLWLTKVWKRVLVSTGNKRNIAKLFSISANIPAFTSHFKDAKLLYMLRDPMDVLPSGLSLVTGVLDKRFNFWSLPKEKRQFYIDRLYNALVELQIRFHDDWVNGRIDKEKVMIVKYDKMMSNFEDLMSDVLNFVDHQPSKELLNEIKKTAEEQRNYESKHQYNLEKFGLTEEKIKKDCAKIYETFFNE